MSNSNIGNKYTCLTEEAALEMALQFKAKGYKCKVYQNDLERWVCKIIGYDL